MAWHWSIILMISYSLLLHEPHGLGSVLHGRYSCLLASDVFGAHGSSSFMVLLVWDILQKALWNGTDQADIHRIQGNHGGHRIFCPFYFILPLFGHSIGATAGDRPGKQGNKRRGEMEGQDNWKKSGTQ